MLIYDDYVTIKITKVKDEFGKFSHWESDTVFSNENHTGGATGPTFGSALDSAVDYLYETSQFWMSDDANKGY